MPIVFLFRELEAAAYGGCGSSPVCDPLIADIYSHFTVCLEQFTLGTKVHELSKHNILHVKSMQLIITAQNSRLDT